MDRRHRRRAQTLDRQLDLLDLKPSLAPSVTPGWSALPAPTRRMLTDLVMRLLVDHAGGAAGDRRSRADDL